MHQTQLTITTERRKVRLLPGLRLELCDAQAQLTPDEALGLANSIVLNVRETIFQSTKTQPPAALLPGLAASSNPDCTTVALRHQGTEMIATLTRPQSEALSKAIASHLSHLQIDCPVNQYPTPFAK